MEKNLSTVKETAFFLKVSTATIYRLTQTGKLKAHRVGNSLRYDLTDLFKN
ncbi:MAG: helix-turn-helix domain-containing protein [Ferruginibacter sp.]